MLKPKAKPDRAKSRAAALIHECITHLREKRMAAGSAPVDIEPELAVFAQIAADLKGDTNGEG